MNLAVQYSCVSSNAHKYQCLSQDNPDEFLRVLSEMGVFGYRSATQLNLVEPDVVPVDNAPSYVTSSDPTLQCHNSQKIPPHKQQKITSQKEISGSGSERLPSYLPQWGVNQALEENNNSKSRVFSKQPVHVNQDNCDTLNLDKSPRNDSCQSKSQRVNDLHRPVQPEPRVVAKAGALLEQDADCQRSDDMEQMAVEKQLQLFPHEAKYLIDHVVYLPVNKTVPFDQLDYLAECVAIAAQRSCDQRQSVGVFQSLSDRKPPKLKSNL